jgi:hypothetical protein
MERTNDAVKTSPGTMSNAIAPAGDKFTAIYDISTRTLTPQPSR